MIVQSGVATEDLSRVRQIFGEMSSEWPICPIGETAGVAASCVPRVRGSVEAASSSDSYRRRRFRTSLSSASHPGRIDSSPMS